MTDGPWPTATHGVRWPWIAIPNCARCHTWSPSSLGLAAGAVCGGELTSGPVDARHQGEPWPSPRAAADAEVERRRALQGRWDHHPPADAGQGHLFILVGIALPAAALMGAALVFGFLANGVPAWIPIVGTLVGVLGGWPIYWVAWVAARAALDRLAYRIGWVDQHGERLFDNLMLAAFVLPAGAVIGTTAVLLGLTG
jgi:hypothetical protein